MSPNPVQIILILILLPVITTGQNITPEIISSAGDRFTKDQVELQWTLGEILIGKYTDVTTGTDVGFHANIEDQQATAVEDYGIPIEVTFFPNPVSNEINILSNVPVRISISNNLETIFQDPNYQRTKKFNLSNLPPGFYWITLENKKRVRYSRAFVKI